MHPDPRRCPQRTGNRLFLLVVKVERRFAFLTIVGQIVLLVVELRIKCTPLLAAPVVGSQTCRSSEFLSRIYDGTLTSSTIPHKERRLIGFDSIPEGLWVSERYDTPSFAVEMSGDETVFDIYPGAYRYICKERGLLLTVVLTEDGEASASIRESPII